MVPIKRRKIICLHIYKKLNGKIPQLCYLFEKYFYIFPFHSGAVISTVASQQEGSSLLGDFYSGVCMFPPGALVSSHSYGYSKLSINANCY